MQLRQHNVMTPLVASSMTVIPTDAEQQLSSNVDGGGRTDGIAKSEPRWQCNLRCGTLLTWITDRSNECDSSSSLAALVGRQPRDVALGLYTVY